MKTLFATTALAALLLATTAFATENRTPSNINAQAQGQFQGQEQGQGQEQSANVANTVNNTNDNGSPSASSKDDTKVFASPGFSMALPSGSNNEMAPEGWSAALSSPFGGFGFSNSEQKPSPSAAYTLGAIAQAAWGERSEDIATENNGITATAFLCTYYKDFAVRARVVCDSE